MIYVVYERGPEVRPRLYRSAIEANLEMERRITDYLERYGERFAAWYARDILRCDNLLGFVLAQWPLALIVLMAIVIGGGLAL